MAANGNENQISAQQQRAIAALLTSRSVPEAAQLAKVGARTLHRWINEDAAFKRALSSAESQLIDAATRRLLQHQEAAITVVLTIMLDKQYSAGVRLRAATTILDSMLRLRELRNIEERLSALEEAYAKT